MTVIDVAKAPVVVKLPPNVIVLEPLLTPVPPFVGPTMDVLDALVSLPFESTVILDSVYEPDVTTVSESVIKPELVIVASPDIVC